jgi:tetratricopeptide (TPR) repeat protein
LEVAVSTVYHQEAGPFEYREFTPPELSTPLASDDERRGNDPALNALGTYVPFSTVAKDAIAALDVDRYLVLYRQYRAAPTHAYSDLLATNTRFERALLDAHRPQDVVRIGEMGLRDFPLRLVFTGDAAYKALAAAYEALGRKADAIATYRKWLRWDPLNPDAISALARLECPAVPCNL